MKTWLQSILLLRDDKQQVVTNGYPYLRVDSIVGCTVKVLDVQVLLDPLEKDPNLPSFSIQLWRQATRGSDESAYRASQTSRSLYSWSGRTGSNAIPQTYEF